MEQLAGQRRAPITLPNLTALLPASDYADVTDLRPELAEWTAAVRDAKPVSDSCCGFSRTSVSTSACNLDHSSGSNGGAEAFCIRRNIDCAICEKRAGAPELPHAPEGS